MKKSTILKWSILTLLVVYSALMAVWAHRQADLHVCEGIDVTVAGNTPMDSIIKRGVKAELRKYPEKLIGRRLNEINTRKIELYLTSLSNFESVNCMLTSTGCMKVEVVPLVPVMRVFTGNKSYYVNKDGKNIESRAEFFTDVPVVRGNFNSSFTPETVLPLIKFIREDKTLSEITGMIDARDSHNLIIVPRVAGHVINFGDTTRLAEKRDVLMRFYHKVMPYKGWEEYDTISVKFRNQVVATRRNKTKLNHSEEYVEEHDLEEGTLPDAPTPVNTPTEQPAAETKQNNNSTNDNTTTNQTQPATPDNI